MNPLVLFDNFFGGNRRTYPWLTKLAIARDCGFDGFEFVKMNFAEDWETVAKLLPRFNFQVLGFHETTPAILDAHADNLKVEIERLQSTIRRLAGLPQQRYLTLSFNGTEELSGPSIAERGSAQAGERHWTRAAQIVAALDQTAQAEDVDVWLYPHIDWLCDTPQSLARILSDARARRIGTTFCSHHWYGNDRSPSLAASLDLAASHRLGNVVLTNGVFTKSSFSATRLDEGEVDIAAVWGELSRRNYRGPVSSQGWGIGGDPWVSCARVAAYLREIAARFDRNPAVNPSANHELLASA